MKGDLAEAMDDSQAKIVASYMLQGHTILEIAEKTGLTKHRVEKLYKSDELKKHLSTISDQLVSVAASTWKGALMERIPKALAVIDKKLNEGDLEAVKIIVKSLGIDKQENPDRGGSLTVVLPEFKREKDIDAETI